MDKLPESLLLHILSRLDDSADVARCRLASKTFDTVYPQLRSVNLQCTLKWYLNSLSRVSNSSSSSSSHIITDFKAVFLDLISNLRVVESVRIGIEESLRDVCYNEDEDETDDLTDGDFVKEWLPRVSGSLKSLSISDFWLQSRRRLSIVLPLVSAYCRNLVELEVKNAWLSVDNLNPMPMLTSLTLEFIRLNDENLDELNKCFPNLQVLNLIGISGLKLFNIQLFKLKTCHLVVPEALSVLMLVMPNLVTLKLECLRITSLYVEAPMLTHFHLSLDHAHVFRVKMFENLKTLILGSSDIESFLSKFPVTNHVENLTLDSQNWERGVIGNSKFTLENVFRVFPNVSSLCINSSAWLELKPSRRGWKIPDGSKGLKKFSAYLLLVDLPLTFSLVACVLNECACLSEVSLLIHRDVVGDVSKSFMAKFMAQWPGLKWKWGVWSEENEDSWVSI